MKLTLKLPAVKYKDIPAGLLFVKPNCVELFVMTGEKVSNEAGTLYFSEKTGERTSLKIAVRVNSIDNEDIYHLFEAFSLEQIANTECYLVNIEGKITEIK